MENMEANEKEIVEEPAKAPEVKSEKKSSKPRKKAAKNICIKVKKLAEDAHMPTLGSAQAAGYDLYAHCDKTIKIKRHHAVKIGTGVAMEIPEGYWGGIFARSGLSCKEGLRPANCVGVIDSDYRGEIAISLHNDRWHKKKIEPGTRIGQIIFIPKVNTELEEAEELDQTERGEGGFGSTGTK